jgi:1-acyl-sn-glycerol-3-phosphate acyltransferase
VPPQRLRDAAAVSALREAVGRAVVAAIGEPADQIVLAPPHTVLKTSSGKVRRSACRERFERGEVGAPVPTTRAQVVHLARDAFVARGRALSVALQRAAFGLWAGTLFWLLAPTFWTLAVLMPSRPLAWRMARLGARALLRGVGVPLAVRGIEQLPPNGGAVLVCNHSSYLDGLVLVAALPRPCAFVAKQELAGQFVAGRFLRRLGAVFVERVDRQRSVEDARRLAQVAARGELLLAFPEGTFVREPGLLPFHLGAFAAAVEAGVPTLPLALRGTREILAYPWQRWPRHGALALDIAPPIAVPDAADGFAAAVRLRDGARWLIVRRLEATGP